MKKSLALAIVLALILTLTLPAIASADNFGYSEARQWHTRGATMSMEMSARIQRGVQYAEYRRLERMVDDANEQIESLVKFCQLTFWNDVDFLVRTTNAIVARVMAYADKIGATVECTYTEYYVDGEYVLIDPLRVVDVAAALRHK